MPHPTSLSAPSITSGQALTISRALMKGTAVSMQLHRFHSILCTIPPVDFRPVDLYRILIHIIHLIAVIHK